MSREAESSSGATASEQKNITFVLVRPIYLGNIGSVARVMKNFAFNNLTLVAPPRNYKDAEARIMAVDAFDILKKCLVHGSLLDAVENSSMVFATTSGRQRAQNLMTLQEAAQEAAELSQSNAVSFVFGDEKNGLGNEELSLCHRLVHIETNPAFPALNLSHAVGVIAYELTRNTSFGKVLLNTEPSYTRRQLPSVKDENEFFSLTQALLSDVDFLREFSREVVMSDLRRLYQRISPTKRELDLVRGALHKLRAALAKGSQNNN